ncbi:MAG: hypothetical protein A3F09_01850 [Chlamydiae bacterium RIFCSPHIGHO2_12_FULL_49_11]|nr:MAG: hypothetical protein A3F09_01850 [Chlamydiae bacterium RIFCSPHIGHO2_12_FULL_49_11]
MQKTIVLRHRRENRKKCSLQCLAEHPDFIFINYPDGIVPSLEGFVMLSLEGPLLTERDRDAGLFIIDGTWRHAKTMEKFVGAECPRRSLPAHFVTAYPRRQNDCADPARGLASIEALFIAFTILGRSTTGLFDRYRWGALFLELNKFTEKGDEHFEHDKNAQKR